MKKRIATIAVGLLSVVVLGGIAYGAAHSVSTTPARQQIFPVRSTKSAGSDDPVDHDIGDDRGIDNPATHDVEDDHGVDDSATHDVGDDHGGTATSTSTPSNTATTLHDAGDDHRGRNDDDLDSDDVSSGSGRSENSGRSGDSDRSDDGPNHG